VEAVARGSRGVSVWRRRVERSGCEVALVELTSGKGAPRPESVYREGGERKKVWCPRRDKTRSKVRERMKRQRVERESE
jgi:hypothetical protein